MSNRCSLLLLISLCAWLSACAITPSTNNTVPAAAIARQQGQLSDLQQWRLQGQIAVFDVRNNQRQALYLDWQQSPERVAMRFSHPLQGTIARLEQDAAGAVLIDDQQRHYYGTDAEQLLRDYFNLALPIAQLPDIVLGRQLPGQQQSQYLLSDAAEPQYGLLTSYRMRADGQWWQAQLRFYRPVTALAERWLPHSVELEARDWRIKMRVTSWQP